ncbi:hypothetical protein ACFRJ1_21260 [Streptomyces sp. NPDC056773]|uniref:hypothetical protein n=1 Tax=unclassified Streptomyces TaxID=2593676 RepID=UPI0020B8514E|nr:hypothetical protein [Streptomyces sp. TBY4]MCP3757991.1 hypothetical protein [Streptomyces sp. TBY4]
MKPTLRTLAALALAGAALSLAGPAHADVTDGSNADGFQSLSVMDDSSSTRNFAPGALDESWIF